MSTPFECLKRLTSLRMKIVVLKSRSNQRPRNSVGSLGGLFWPDRGQVSREWAKSNLDVLPINP